MNDEDRGTHDAIQEVAGSSQANGVQESAGTIADSPDVVTEEGVGQGGFIAYMGRHPKGFWFFFWGEFAERCSYYGMRAILAKYMADQLGLGQDNAATYMSVFIGACYLLPLVGGWVADNYLGKYWTIVSFSIPYILGHVILGIESVPALVIALALLAMGSGVIKPNISTLMGLTYDQQRPGQTKLRSDAFAIFYFAINVGAALSQFLMPPIRSAYGYAIAFLFPAALMVLAFIIFALGKKYYAVEVIERRRSTPEERAERWRILGRIFGLFFLVMFFWAIFDQAASTWIFFTEACMDRHIFGYEMDADQMQFFNPVLILILLPPITVFIKFLQSHGWRIRPTDKMLVGFVLTAGCMGVMALAAVLAGEAELRPGLISGRENEPIRIAVNDNQFTQVIDQRTERVRVDATSQTRVVVSYEEVGPDGRPNGITGSLKFTGDGVLKLAPVEEKDGEITKLRIEGKVTEATFTRTPEQTQPSTIAKGDVNAVISGNFGVSKRWFVAPDRQVTVWWLVLAYLVITIGEILISVTGLELAYTAAPKSMTSFVTACWLLVVFLANILINVPITRLYPAMQPVAYFGMLTAIMVVVTVAFVFVGQRFNRSQASEPAAA